MTKPAALDPADFADAIDAADPFGDEIWPDSDGQLRWSVSDKGAAADDDCHLQA